MITKEKVKRAYDSGIIKIVDSPNGDGAVCEIGELRFCFGGVTAEEETAESYVQNVPREDIVDEIFEPLEGYRKDDSSFFGEYAYCETYITCTL